jgi:3-oxoacyl-[acyl-carrier protein] reductase
METAIAGVNGARTFRTQKRETALMLEERVVIVTGGARGIGRTYSLALAREGAKVMIADISDGSDVVEEIGREGGEADSIQVDVSDQQSTENMAKATAERFGRIDVLINNAGYFTTIERGPWTKWTVEEWDHCFAVNVRGVWLCCLAVYPYMKEQKYGKIINITSNVVWRGVPNFLHYVASKSALLGLTRSLAREVGDDNIGVNAVAPEFITHDPDVASKYGALEDMVVASRVFKRKQTPEDMVGIILFLAGPESDFITGQSFLVNGGSFFQ